MVKAEGLAPPTPASRHTMQILLGIVLRDLHVQRGNSAAAFWLHLTQNWKDPLRREFSAHTCGSWLGKELSCSSMTHSDMMSCCITPQSP